MKSHRNAALFLAFLLAGCNCLSPVAPGGSLVGPIALTVTGQTTLSVGSILNNGFGGTTNLIVPAGTAGLGWEVTPKNYVPILGPIVGQRSTERSRRSATSSAMS